MTGCVLQNPDFITTLFWDFIIAVMVLIAFLIIEMVFKVIYKFFKIQELKARKEEHL